MSIPCISNQKLIVGNQADSKAKDHTISLFPYHVLDGRSNDEDVWSSDDGVVLASRALRSCFGLNARVLNASCWWNVLALTSSSRLNVHHPRGALNDGDGDGGWNLGHVYGGLCA
jgi:hypothetical protein